MAKSLRAKKPARARADRRKNVFEPHEKERALRLAKKLGSIKQQESMQVDNETGEQEKQKDEITSKKVSTSGWKGSRNDSYKKKRAKKNKALKF